MTTAALDRLVLPPAPSPEPGEPDLWMLARRLLEHLVWVFGPIDGLAALADPRQLRLLHAWVLSLESAVRRLLLLTAVTWLCEGMVLGVRVGRHAPTTPRASTYRPRQATPWISQAADPKPGDRAPPETGMSHGPDPESGPTPAGVPARLDPQNLARRILAAAALLAQPLAPARRLARRIAYAEAVHGQLIGFDPTTPEVRRDGCRPPYRPLLVYLDRALREIQDARARASPCS